MKKKIWFFIILVIVCLGLLTAIILTEVFNVPGVSSICGLILGFLLPYVVNKGIELKLNKQQWKIWKYSKVFTPVKSFTALILKR